MKAAAFQLLSELLRSALDAVSASSCVPGHLRARPRSDRTCVIGAGKAAAAMAHAVEQHWGDMAYGAVITRYGHAVECEFIEVIEAAHPIPDESGLNATRSMMRLARSLDASGNALCLISGGASALMTLPHHDITLQDKQAITRQLLAAGASIAEINQVRKHLSGIKGGRLMEAISPSRALTLCISDVAGDDVSVIGSGPTVADRSTCHDALSVLNEHRIDCPSYIVELLRRGKLETPKPHHPAFSDSEIIIAAKSSDALEAGARSASRLGIRPIVLSDAIEGDSGAMARYHAKLVKRMIRDSAGKEPFVILSGGETTVAVSGSGQGGPNTQFALALAKELDGLSDVYAIACDTDGIDGTSDSAGARIEPATVERGKRLGMDVNYYLKNNNSHEYFKKLDDLVNTGPTLTNVNDFRAIYYSGY